jgi:ABC-type multidrug transport system fused ATPase/permease subunit
MIALSPRNDKGFTAIRNEDRIAVLKQGEMVEQGNQETLLAQGGLYASL